MKSNTIPDFFLAGQPKTGSTALEEMLRQHPEIYMPGEAIEPSFFSPDAWPKPTRSRPIPHIFTVDQYESLFENALPSQLLGERSTSYFASSVAARNIAQVNPRARIVIVLREPASLLCSYHAQVMQHGNETVTSTRKALALEPDRRSGRKIPKSSTIPRHLLYSRLVRYVEHLSRFHAEFPQEQIKTFIYDDFKADPQTMLGDIYTFLGVQKSFVPEPVSANPSVIPRAPRTRDLLRRALFGYGPVLSQAKRASQVVPTHIRRELVRRVESRFETPGARHDAELIMELRRRYASEVHRLSEYLDRDLVSLWGYR